MFYTTFTSTFTTPLPPGTRKLDVLALLHDPSSLISLSPAIRTHRRIDPPEDSAEPPKPSSGDKSVYEITEAVPLLPFHLWDITVPFTADFAPLDDGTDSVVNAPGGLVIVSEWRVRGEGNGNGSGEEEGEGLVLEEKAAVKCGVFVSLLVKTTHRKVHQDVHRLFLERLKEKEAGEGEVG